MRRLIIMLLIAAMLLAAMSGCGSAASTAESAVSGTETPEETAEGPQTVNEAVYGSEPQTVNEAVYGSEPQTVAEAVYGSEPQTVNEAVYGSEFQTVNDAVYGSEPETGMPEPERIAASIGDVTFAFTNQGEFHDLTYQYPDAMELDKDEENDRDLINYYAEDYDPFAFGVQVTRMQGNSIEEVLEGLLRLETDTAVEEYNGISWTVGTVEVDNDEGNITRKTVYVSIIGDYEYVLLFQSPCANIYDFADFAKVFAQNVALK